MNDEETLAPSRGLVNGLALGFAFWLGVVVTIVGVFVVRACGYG